MLPLHGLCRNSLPSSGSASVGGAVELDAVTGCCLAGAVGFLSAFCSLESTGPFRLALRLVELDFGERARASRPASCVQQPAVCVSLAACHLGWLSPLLRAEGQKLMG